MIYTYIHTSIPYDDNDNDNDNAIPKTENTRLL